MSKTLMMILFAVAACGGKKPETTSTTTQPMSGSNTSASGGEAVCVETMTRSRTCTTEFIPALVDLRAKHNNPEGIADAVKADRNAVISQALTEWATDSKDEAIARKCPQMASAMPDADVAAAKDCLAVADCAGFVACVMPQIEKHIAK
jgi:hypothetical protein